jgi:uncharacterized protein YjbI with pentapeptide repeats
MSTESKHDLQGNAQGEFAAYVDVCREWSLAGDGPRQTFHSIRYVNEAKDRRFPLRNCEIEGDEIRGQYFSMVWIDCVFRKVDFSHTRGQAHWTRVMFERINFHHLMGNVSAAQTLFRSCNFGNVVLDQPVFMQCKFVKTKLSGALIGAMFIDCEFEDVDLKGSRWEDPQVLDIRGTWKNAEHLWETSSPKAKALFLRKPVEPNTE